MSRQVQQPAQIVSISYEELLDNAASVIPKIEEGFGASGLGVVTVSGVPDVLKLRKRLLLLADKFATLPDHIKQRYTDPLGGLASVGWSRGVEALEDGRPDLNKGSYYANPLHDSVTTDEALLREYPSYTTPNVWPDADFPELRPAFQELGQLIIKVGVLLARQCDEYVQSQNPQLEEGKLERVIRDSPNPKGRLLHYYPPTAADDSSNWCTQHTDHGSLTGLMSALYTKDRAEVPNPDPSSGLYIRDRNGAAVKAPIPADHIAFQMGEAMQVHSGGLLRATPHYVRMAKGSVAVGVARNTLAIFMQPRWDEPMDLPAGSDPATVGIGQWQPGISFGEFSELTVKKYFAPKSAASGA